MAPTLYAGSMPGESGEVQRIDRISSVGEIGERDQSRILEAGRDIGQRVVADTPTRRRQAGSVVLRPNFRIGEIPEEFAIGATMKQAA